MALVSHKCVADYLNVPVHRTCIHLVFGLYQNRCLTAVIKGVVFYRNISAHSAFVPAFCIVGQQNTTHSGADEMIVLNIYPASCGNQQTSCDNPCHIIIFKIEVRTGTYVFNNIAHLCFVRIAYGQPDVILINKHRFFNNRRALLKQGVGVDVCDGVALS